MTDNTDLPLWVDSRRSQRTVFDNSRSGAGFGGIRSDEPGNEDFSLSDGGGTDNGGYPPRKYEGDMRVSQARGGLTRNDLWHPPTVNDPGYVYTPAQLTAINATDDPLAAARAMPARPWSVPAFKPAQHPLEGIRFNSKDSTNADS